MAEKSLLIENIAREYHSGKSAKEVGEALGVSEKKVRYQMKKAGIKARPWSEATYYKRNPTGDPFKIMEHLHSREELLLFFVTLGLYLGEGTKKGKHNVALANTNPDILLTFLNFLRNICVVDESKIFAELNIFDDVGKSAAVRYWTKTVGISNGQIKYIISRKSKGGTPVKPSKNLTEG